MADPVFDEELIVELFKSAVNRENTGRIQQAAVHMLADLYDRGVTRDEFISMATLCISLYAQCAKLWVLGNVEEVFDAGDLTNERFKIGSGQLEEIIRKQCMDAIEVMKRLQDCPTSADKVH
jgi:hypothetical protein